MQVIAASPGLPTGVWVGGFETLMHWTGRSLEVTDGTVRSVGYYTRDPAVLIEGFLEDGFAPAEVSFRVELLSGAFVRAVGTPEEYEKLVRSCIRAPGDNVFTRIAREEDEEAAAHAAAGLPDGLRSGAATRQLAAENDRDLLRAEFARWRASRQDRGSAPRE